MVQNKEKQCFFLFSWLNTCFSAFTKISFDSLKNIKNGKESKIKGMFKGNSFFFQRQERGKRSLSEIYILHISVFFTVTCND